jgi:two-component system nitrogen regulation response regulator GlnG
MSEPRRIWIVDDDPSIRWVLERALSQPGLQVECFDNPSRVIDALSHQTPSVLISDVRMPGMDGFRLLNRLREQLPSLPIIIMTAYSDLDSAVQSFQGGAFDYLPKPFDVDEAVALVHRALSARRQPETESVESDSSEVSWDSGITGEAPAMQEVFRAVGRLSRSNITVLITGESGTGKELVAHALHQHSPRAHRPFIALNTAAIPRDLLESELFGHERGAFTGAQSQRRGRFEQADGGTLFLDEIGDMPAELQTRLLRVLADGEFYRVGGHNALKVDVRIIAATHQDLEKRVREGGFREDLFHRLNVIRIRIPPLRERREDIPQLMRQFLDRSAVELDVEPKRLLPEVEEFLVAQEWPGNVRQLENLSRWLTVMASGPEVHMEDLPPELKESAAQSSVEESHDEAEPPPSGRKEWEQALKTWARRELSTGKSAILENAVPRFERVMIQVALEQARGRRLEAARLLGWGRNTLTRKIRELGMEDRAPH